MKTPARTHDDFNLENKLDLVRTLFSLKQRIERRKFLKYNIEPAIIGKHNEQLLANGSTDGVDEKYIDNFLNNIIKELSL